MKDFCNIMKKTITLILILSFTITSITPPGYAFNNPGLFKKTSHAQRYLKTETEHASNGLDSLLSLTLPNNIATVVERFKGREDSLIIHIQDRHSDPLAQFNIAATIEELTTKQDISLLCLEGASKELDTSFYDKFPDTDLKAKVSKLFVKKGLFTGAEFYKITNNRQYLRALGAEDKDLYLKHLASYQKNQIDKEAVLKIISRFNNGIERLKRHIYTPQLNELDKLSISYEAKLLTLSDYLNKLAQYSKMLNIDIARYPNLDEFTKLIKTEKRIDFKKAQKEREALIAHLSKRLGEGEMGELLKLSLEFRLNKIQDVAFYAYLEKFLDAKTYNINTKGYRHLIAYIGYLKFSKTINHLKVFEEAEELADETMLALCKDEMQRRLACYSKALKILKDLYQLKLTKRYLNYIGEHADYFDIGKMDSFIAKASERYAIPSDSIISKDNISPEALNNSKRFYEIAQRRDIALVENTIKDMGLYRKKRAILITGGFHTDGITNILREKGISYVVICPNVSQEDCEKIYADRMIGRLPDMTEMAEVLKNMLVAPLVTGDVAVQAGGIEDIFAKLMAESTKAGSAEEQEFTSGKQTLVTVEEVTTKSGVKIERLLNMSIPVDINKQKALLGTAAEIVAGFSKDELLAIIRTIAKDKKLTWEQLDPMVSLEYIGSGTHKYVFCLKINRLDDMEISALIALKHEITAGDITSHELHNLRQLNGKGVPRFGDYGRAPDGRMWYMEEFIEGPTANELAEKGRLSTELKKRIIATLLLISTNLGGMVPRDIHGNNFIFKNTTQEAVMVDIGEKRLYISGKNRLPTHILLFLGMLMSQYGFWSTGNPEREDFIFDALLESEHLAPGKGLAILRQAQGELQKQGIENAARLFYLEGRNMFWNIGGHSDDLRPVIKFTEHFMQSLAAYLAKTESRRGPPPPVVVKTGQAPPKAASAGEEKVNQLLQEAGASLKSIGETAESLSQRYQAAGTNQQLFQIQQLLSEDKIEQAESILEAVLADFETELKKLNSQLETIEASLTAITRMKESLLEAQRARLKQEQEDKLAAIARRGFLGNVIFDLQKRFGRRRSIVDPLKPKEDALIRACADMQSRLKISKSRAENVPVEICWDFWKFLDGAINSYNNTMIGRLKVLAEGQPEQAQLDSLNQDYIDSVVMPALAEARAKAATNGSSITPQAEARFLAHLKKSFGAVISNLPYNASKTEQQQAKELDQERRRLSYPLSRLAGYYAHCAGNRPDMAYGRIMSALNHIGRFERSAQFRRRLLGSVDRICNLSTKPLGRNRYLFFRQDDFERLEIGYTAVARKIIETDDIQRWLVMRRSPVIKSIFGEEALAATSEALFQLIVRDMYQELKEESSTKSACVIRLAALRDKRAIWPLIIVAIQGGHTANNAKEAIRTLLSDQQVIDSLSPEERIKLTPLIEKMQQSDQTTIALLDVSTEEILFNVAQDAIIEGLTSQDDGIRIQVLNAACSAPRNADVTRILAVMQDRLENSEGCSKQVLRFFKVRMENGDPGAIKVMREFIQRYRGRETEIAPAVITAAAALHHAQASRQRDPDDYFERLKESPTMQKALEEERLLRQQVYHAAPVILRVKFSIEEIWSFGEFFKLCIQTYDPAAIDILIDYLRTGPLAEAESSGILKVCLPDAFPPIDEATKHLCELSGDNDLPVRSKARERLIDAAYEMVNNVHGNNQDCAEAHDIVAKMLSLDLGVLRGRHNSFVSEEINAALIEINAKAAKNKQVDIKRFWQRHWLTFVLLQSLDSEYAEQIFLQILRGLSPKRLELFLQSLNKPLRNGKVRQSLKTIFKQTQNRDPAFAQRILELTEAYQALDLVPLLEQVVQQEIQGRHLEIKSAYLILAERLLKAFGEKLGISPDKITASSIENWHLPYLSKLFVGRGIIQGHGGAYRPLQQLFDSVIKATLEGRFSQFLTDTSSANNYPMGDRVAAQNKRVRESLAALGVDVETWLNYDQLSKPFDLGGVTQTAENEQVILDNLAQHLLNVVSNIRPDRRDAAILGVLKKHDINLIEGPGQPHIEYVGNGTGKQDKQNFHKQLHTALERLNDTLTFLQTKYKDNPQVLHIIDELRGAMNNAINYLENKHVEGGTCVVRRWARNPGRDIFQGNFTHCCVAIDNNLHPEAIVEYLIDQGVQVVEVVDQENHATIAQAWLFITHEKGRPVLVIDNVEVVGDYPKGTIENNKIRDQIFSYIWQYADAIKVKDVRLGYTLYNDVDTVGLPRITNNLRKAGGFLWDFEKQNQGFTYYFEATLGESVGPHPRGADGSIAPKVSQIFQVPKPAAKEMTSGSPADSREQVVSIVDKLDISSSQLAEAESQAYAGNNAGFVQGRGFYERILDNPASINVVLRQRERVIGCIVSVPAQDEPIAPHIEKSLYLEDIFILPEFRGGGGFLKMFNEFLLQAQAKGYTDITLHTHRRFADYLKRNFSAEQIGTAPDWLNTGIEFYILRINIEKALAEAERLARLSDGNAVNTDILGADSGAEIPPAPKPASAGNAGDAARPNGTTWNREDREKFEQLHDLGMTVRELIGRDSQQRWNELIRRSRRAGLTPKESEECADLSKRLLTAIDRGIQEMLTYPELDMGNLESGNLQHIDKCKWLFRDPTTGELLSEIVIIDYERDENLRNCYAEIVEEFLAVLKEAGINEEDIRRDRLNRDQKQLLLNTLFNVLTDIGYSKTAFTEERYKRKPILIGQAWKRGGGVCRHMGLLAAAIMYRMKKEGLLKGDVFYCRGDNHGWAVYVPGAYTDSSYIGDLLIFDIAQHKEDGIVTADEIFDGHDSRHQYREFIPPAVMDRSRADYEAEDDMTVDPKRVQRDIAEEIKSAGTRVFLQNRLAKLDSLVPKPPILDEKDRRLVIKIYELIFTHMEELAKNMVKHYMSKAKRARKVELYLVGGHASNKRLIGYNTDVNLIFTTDNPGNSLARADSDQTKRWDMVNDIVTHAINDTFSEEAIEKFHRETGLRLAGVIAAKLNVISLAGRIDPSRPSLLLAENRAGRPASPGPTKSASAGDKEPKTAVKQISIPEEDWYLYYQIRPYELRPTELGTRKEKRQYKDGAELVLKAETISTGTTSKIITDNSVIRMGMLPCLGVIIYNTKTNKTYAGHSFATIISPAGDTIEDTANDKEMNPEDVEVIVAGAGVASDCNAEEIKHIIRNRQKVLDLLQQKGFTKIHQFFPAQVSATVIIIFDTDQGICYPILMAGIEGRNPTGISIDDHLLSLQQARARAQQKSPKAASAGIRLSSGKDTFVTMGEIEAALKEKYTLSAEEKRITGVFIKDLVESADSDFQQKLILSVVLVSALGENDKNIRDAADILEAVATFEGLDLSLTPEMVMHYKELREKERERFNRIRRGVLEQAPGFLTKSRSYLGEKAIKDLAWLIDEDLEERLREKRERIFPLDFTGVAMAIQRNKFERAYYLLEQIKGKERSDIEKIRQELGELFHHPHNAAIRHNVMNLLGAENLFIEVPVAAKTLKRNIGQTLGGERKGGELVDLFSPDEAIWIQAGSYWYKVWLNDKNDGAVLQRQQKEGEKIAGKHPFGFREEYTVGRTEGVNEYNLPSDRQLSSRHFSVRVTTNNAGQFFVFVKDFNSTNGTTVAIKSASTGKGFIAKVIEFAHNYRLNKELTQRTAAYKKYTAEAERMEALNRILELAAQNVNNEAVKKALAEIIRYDIHAMPMDRERYLFNKALISISESISSPLKELLIEIITAENRLELYEFLEILNTAPKQRIAFLKSSFPDHGFEFARERVLTELAKLMDAGDSETAEFILAKFEADTGFAAEAALALHEKLGERISPRLEDIMGEDFVGRLKVYTGVRRGIAMKWRWMRVWQNKELMAEEVRNFKSPYLVDEDAQRILEEILRTSATRINLKAQAIDDIVAKVENAKAEAVFKIENYTDGIDRVINLMRALSQKGYETAFTVIRMPSGEFIFLLSRGEGVVFPLPKVLEGFLPWARLWLHIHPPYDKLARASSNDFVNLIWHIGNNFYKEHPVDFILNNQGDNLTECRFPAIEDADSKKETITAGADEVNKKLNETLAGIFSAQPALKSPAKSASTGELTLDEKKLIIAITLAVEGKIDDAISLLIVKEPPAALGHPWDMKVLSRFISYCEDREGSGLNGRISLLMARITFYEASAPAKRIGFVNRWLGYGETEYVMDSILRKETSGVLKDILHAQEAPLVQGGAAKPASAKVTTSPQKQARIGLDLTSGLGFLEEYRGEGINITLAQADEKRLRLQIIRYRDLPDGHPLKGNLGQVDFIIFNRDDPQQWQELDQIHPMTIGRERPGRFSVSTIISRSHLIISREGNNILILDNNSRNGTRIENPSKEAVERYTLKIEAQTQGYDERAAGEAYTGTMQGAHREFHTSTWDRIEYSVDTSMPVYTVEKTADGRFKVSVNPDFKAPNIGQITINNIRALIEEIINDPSQKNLGGFLCLPKNAAAYLDLDFLIEARWVMSQTRHENEEAESAQDIFAQIKERTSRFIEGYLIDACNDADMARYRKGILTGIREATPDSRTAIVSSDIPEDIILASEATEDELRAANDKNRNLMVVEPRIFFDPDMNGEAAGWRIDHATGKRLAGEKYLIAHWKGRHFIFYVSRSHTDKRLSTEKDKIRQWRSASLGIWTMAILSGRIEKHPQGEHLDECLPALCVGLDRFYAENRDSLQQTDLESFYKWVCDLKLSYPPDKTEETPGTVLHVLGSRRGRMELTDIFVGDVWFEFDGFTYKLWVRNGQINCQRHDTKYGEPIGKIEGEDDIGISFPSYFEFEVHQTDKPDQYQLNVTQLKEGEDTLIELTRPPKAASTGSAKGYFNQQLNEVEAFINQGRWFDARLRLKTIMNSMIELAQIGQGRFKKIYGIPQEADLINGLALAADRAEKLAEEINSRLSSEEMPLDKIYPDNFETGMLKIRNGAFALPVSYGNQRAVVFYNALSTSLYLVPEDVSDVNSFADSLLEGTALNATMLQITDPAILTAWKKEIKRLAENAEAFRAIEESIEQQGIAKGTEVRVELRAPTPEKGLEKTGLTAEDLRVKVEGVFDHLSSQHGIALEDPNGGINYYGWHKGLSSVVSIQKAQPPPLKAASTGAEKIVKLLNGARGSITKRNPSLLAKVNPETNLNNKLSTMPVLLNFTDAERTRLRSLIRGYFSYERMVHRIKGNYLSPGRANLLCLADFTIFSRSRLSEILQPLMFADSNKYEGLIDFLSMYGEGIGTSSIDELFASHENVSLTLELFDRMSGMLGFAYTGITIVYSPRIEEIPAIVVDAPDEEHLTRHLLDLGFSQEEEARLKEEVFTPLEMKVLREEWIVRQGLKTHTLSLLDLQQGVFDSREVMIADGILNDYIETVVVADEFFDMVYQKASPAMREKIARTSEYFDNNPRIEEAKRLKDEIIAIVQRAEGRKSQTDTSIKSASGGDYVAGEDILGRVKAIKVDAAEPAMSNGAVRYTSGDIGRDLPILQTPHLGGVEEPVGNKEGLGQSPPSLISIEGLEQPPLKSASGGEIMNKIKEVLRGKIEMTQRQKDIVNIFIKDLTEGSSADFKEKLIFAIILVNALGETDENIQDAVDILQADVMFERLGLYLTPEMIMYYKALRKNEREKFNRVRIGILRHTPTTKAMAASYQGISAIKEVAWMIDEDLEARFRKNKERIFPVNLTGIAMAIQSNNFMAACTISWQVENRFRHDLHGARVSIEELAKQPHNALIRRELMGSLGAGELFLNAPVTAKTMERNIPHGLGGERKGGELVDIVDSDEEVFINAGSLVYKIRPNDKNDGAILSWQSENFSAGHPVKLGMEYTIGRKVGENDYGVPFDQQLSGQHFSVKLISNKSGQFFIFVKDRNSANGTLVAIRKRTTPAKAAAELQSVKSASAGEYVVDEGLVEGIGAVTKNTTSILNLKFSCYDERDARRFGFIIESFGYLGEADKVLLRNLADKNKRSKVPKFIMVVANDTDKAMLVESLGFTTDAVYTLDEYLVRRTDGTFVDSDDIEAKIAEVAIGMRADIGKQPVGIIAGQPISSRIAQLIEQRQAKGIFVVSQEAPDIKEEYVVMGSEKVETEKAVLFGAMFAELVHLFSQYMSNPTIAIEILHIIPPVTDKDRFTEKIKSLLTSLEEVSHAA